MQSHEALLSISAVCRILGINKETIDLILGAKHADDALLPMADVDRIATILAKRRTARG